MAALAAGVTLVPEIVPVPTVCAGGVPIQLTEQLVGVKLQVTDVPVADDEKVETPHLTNIDPQFVPVLWHRLLMLTCESSAP